MLKPRVIPFLLVSKGQLIKTVQFKSPRYLGDPINTVRILNEKEVDELAIIDIGASSEGRGPNLDLLKSVTSECFMPVAYGGGIRDLVDAQRVLRVGIEKLVVRSLALDNLSRVAEISKYAGESSVAVSIDIKQSRFGGWCLYCPGSKSHGHPDWPLYLEKVIQAGAGEIVLNAVHRDGTMVGMDTKMIAMAAQITTVPLVAVGGVGSLLDIRAGLNAGADAVGAGSFFVYHGPRKAVLITYPSQEELRNVL